MPRNERLRQKKLLRRKQKAKAAGKWRNAQAIMEASPRALIRKAREYPILECLINDNWDTDDAEGFAQMVIARQQPDGDIVFGVYLVDMYCLGLKSTYCNAGFSPARYRSEIASKVIREARPKQAQPELVHQILYQAIDYAAQYGFKPDKDFKLSRYLLEERGVLEEPYKLTFGRDGKPFFIAGPYDNVDVIMRKLERNAGPDNYEYMIRVGDIPEDLEFLDALDEDYDDDDDQE
jgi:hypothetical protein